MTGTRISLFYYITFFGSVHARPRIWFRYFKTIINGRVRNTIFTNHWHNNIRRRRLVATIIFVDTVSSYTTMFFSLPFSRVQQVLLQEYNIIFQFLSSITRKIFTFRKVFTYKTRLLNISRGSYNSSALLLRT